MQQLRDEESNSAREENRFEVELNLIQLNQTDDVAVLPPRSWHRRVRHCRLVHEQREE